MLDLLKNFTPTEIIVFVVGLVLAIKGSWDLIDYFRNKYKEKFNKDYMAKKEDEILQKSLELAINQHKETLDLYGSLDTKMDTLTELVTDKFEEIEKNIERLTISDMHDIKQAIVKSYHYFVEKQGWIDDFSLDTLEHRYNDYVLENGNSYIAGLMAEIRQLPKHRP